MTITICASLAFYDESLAAKEQLESQGHTVLWPWGMEEVHAGRLSSPEKLAGFKETPGIHSRAIHVHYEKIKKSDAILVVNVKKNGVEQYIGGNTLMEMGFAFVLNKKIYLLHPIPQDLSYTEEIVAMLPVVLDGDVGRITT